MIDKLQFISQEASGLSQLRCIENACKAGVKWVQLRVKNKPTQEIIAIARHAKVICDEFEAMLIINDNPYVAKEVNAYGLHLGKEDMPIAEARKIVKTETIIGGTANTLEDIIAHAKNGADYVGLGPFRFTKTKEKLSPILGLEGYRQIVSDAKKSGVILPIIAIGGIETADIPSILETGIYGVAVSSLIAFAANPKEVVTKVNKILKEGYHVKDSR